MNLQLVKTENFNDISCDFYSADDQLLPNWKQLMENLTLVISIMNVAFMKFVEEVDNPRLMPLWIGYGM